MWTLNPAVSEKQVPAGISKVCGPSFMPKDTVEVSGKKKKVRPKTGERLEGESMDSNLMFT